MQILNFINRCQPKKKLVFLATLGICCLSSLPAWALPLGSYTLQGAGEDSFYGVVNIASMDGDAGRCKLPKTDFFSITTYDGVEPIRLYAGILHKNGPKSAEGTLLYSMSNAERYAAGWNKQFATGIWYQPVNCTKSDIRFTLKNGKLSYSFANPDILLSRGGYVPAGYQATNMSNQLALKICVLEKVRQLWHWGSENTIIANKYRFSYNDSFKFHNITMVQPKGSEEEYSLNDDLTELNYEYANGNRTMNLLWIPKQQ